MKKIVPQKDGLASKRRTKKTDQKDGLKWKARKEKIIINCVFFENTKGNLLKKSEEITGQDMFVIYTKELCLHMPCYGSQIRKVNPTNAD